MSTGVSSPISQITQALSAALSLSSGRDPRPPPESNITEGSNATSPQSTEPTQANEEGNEEVQTPPQLPPMSSFSSPAVGAIAWCAHDFMLGAGMVIIQRNTHKIVVIYETKLNYWFFPRGRKDVGESIEEAAFREAYEESGFRVQPLPLLIPTRQPSAPSSRYRYNPLNTEPIFLTMSAWQPRMTRDHGMDDGGQYLTTWFAGQIDQNAVPEIGTGMPDEQNYQTHLLTIEQAKQHVWGCELSVLEYVWEVYRHTQHELLEAERRRAEQLRARVRASWNNGISFFSRRRST